MRMARGAKFVCIYLVDSYHIACIGGPRQFQKGEHERLQSIAIRAERRHLCRPLAVTLRARRAARVLHVGGHRLYLVVAVYPDNHQNNKFLAQYTSLDDVGVSLPLRA